MIDKEKLSIAVKKFNGYEDKNHNIFILWTVECKDPVKYVFGFKSDNISSTEELLKLLTIRTKREKAVIIEENGIIINGERIKWTEFESKLNDDFLKKVLKLAEKL